MALFPSCKFHLETPVIDPGVRYEGVLKLDVPAPIPRAERLDFSFRTVAQAGYGAGRERSVRSHTMFSRLMTFDLTGRGLLPGAHEIPFVLDTPPWLPARTMGYDCSITHVLRAYVVVDWAKDLEFEWTPTVLTPPTEGARQPLVLRSPPHLCGDVLLEITLDSSVIAIGESLVGQIAVRSGHETLRSVHVTLMSADTITMVRGDRRVLAWQGGKPLAIESLRAGRSVSFELQTFPTMVATHRNGFIDHGVILRIRVDGTLGADRCFDIPLLLPAGSTIHGHGQRYTVGADRMRQLSSELARRTGLREGRHPVLVEGDVGGVGFSVSDGARGNAIGADLLFSFRDVDLGLELRPRGLLDRFRNDSPLLPEPLRETYALRVEPEGRAAREDVIAQFLPALLGDLGNAGELRLSDHHLGLHVALGSDELDVLTPVVRLAQAKRG